MSMDIFYPFQYLADLVTYTWLKIPQDRYLAGAINFWIYDVLKISLLLLFINFFMAITRYYFPMEKVRDLLVHKRWYGFQYVLAALLGVITPFCSCSSLPLFMGFLSAGIPLGVTFVFLISSPLVNESSLFLFPSVFGWEITILYHCIGITLSVVGGMLIQSLKLEKYIDSQILSLRKAPNVQQKVKTQAYSFRQLLSLWISETWQISKKIYPYLILGITFGAIIHGYIPERVIVDALSSQNIWTIPLAVLFGIPLYANSVSVIPIIEALIIKGVPVGTALAFMTATVTLSLPEVLILKKIMRWQLLITFLGISTFGIVLMGYFFNWLS